MSDYWPRKFTVVGTLDDLHQCADNEHKAHNRVVLTGGCFDLFHAGHARLLAFAQEQGDILFVAVNSDETVRLLKGDDRPIYPIEDRLDLVAGHVSVDYAIEQTDILPDDIIRDVRPHIYVKGEQYRDRLLEEPILRELGAEIVYAPMHGTRSTTDTLRRLRGENRG